MLKFCHISDWPRRPVQKHC